MPKYITYGNYDEDQNTYTGNTEKEISGASAEEILRGNEEAAVENAPESESDSKDKAKSEDKKESFYKKSTANEANSREVKPGDFTRAGILSRVNGVKGKSGGGKFSRRLAPLFFVIALTGAGAIGVGFSQVMMPFHVIESLTEMTDGSFTARQARMPKLVRWMFNMEMETDATKEIRGLLGGSTTRYRSSIKSKRVKNRLAAEGIDVVEEGGVTVLNYHQPDGSVRTVKADEYTELWRSDSDFRNKMNRGGRSFLGRIAAHIDLTLANFLNSHNLTKNLFKGWINKVYDAEGQTVRLHNVIEARKPTTTGNTGAVSVDDDGSDDVSKMPKNQVDIDSSMDETTMKKNYGEMITNIASITTAGVCGAAAIASAVTAAKVVIAYENARGAFSGAAEAVDKVKAGHGDESPINPVANDFAERDENGLTRLQSEAMKWVISGGNYKPDINADDVKEVSADLFFSGNIFSSLATSTNFVIGCAIANVTTAAISIIADIASLGTFSIGKALFAVGGSIIASEAVSLLADKLVENAKTDFCLDATGPKAGACLYLGATKYNSQNFQAGGGSLATKDKAEGFYSAYKIALADEAELIRSTKSPFDASSSHTFLGSIVSKLGMIAIEMPSLSSMASALTNLASTSFASLMPAASAVDEFSYFSNQLRDDCANLQFGDIQALGDLNCEPVFITDQSINSQKVGGIAEVAGETSAAKGSSGIDPEYIFKVLKEADSFEYENSDKTTLKKVDKNGKLLTGDDRKKDGVEVINKDSTLAKYIENCAYRSSPFGHVDQNIMTKESQVLIDTTTGSGPWAKLKSWLKTLIGAVPILGEIVDAAESGEQIKTIGWSTGANCVARSDGKESKMNVSGIDGSNGEETGDLVNIDLVSWNDLMRYIQAYVADDRFMQTSYEDYISPVQIYAEKQGLVESDSNLSTVAYLSKYTGYTEENMQIALNELEYWTYIAQYNPEGKGPMVFDAETDEVYDFELPGREIYEDYETQVASMRQYVVYADLRNRYSAVA